MVLVDLFMSFQLSMPEQFHCPPIGGREGGGVANLGREHVHVYIYIYICIHLPLKNTTFQLFGGHMGYMSVKY